MKDEITIGLNGKTIASFGIELKGRGINVKSIGSFVVSTGSDEGNDVMNIQMGCILGEEIVEEKKVVPIEPMVNLVDPTPTPVQMQMKDISSPVPPGSNYNEIPIKTGRKPRGPNKPKEAPEKSVFDKEDIVQHAEEIEKKGKFVSLEDAAKELKLPVELVTSVSVSPTPITAVGGSVLSPPKPSTPTTPVRINELAKLIKMWCKAAQFKIEDVTIEVLNAHGASDIIENDSPETVNAGIEEAKRLMKG